MFPVLILVLMDDALVRHHNQRGRYHFRVLILVLMDDALVLEFIAECENYKLS